MRIVVYFQLFIPFPDFSIVLVLTFLSSSSQSVSASPCRVILFSPQCLRHFLHMKFYLFSFCVASLLSLSLYSLISFLLYSFLFSFLSFVCFLLPSSTRLIFLLRFVQPLSSIFSVFIYSPLFFPFIPFSFHLFSDLHFSNFALSFPTLFSFIFALYIFSSFFSIHSLFLCHLFQLSTYLLLSLLFFSFVLFLCFLLPRFISPLSPLHFFPFPFPLLLYFLLP